MKTLHLSSLILGFVLLISPAHAQNPKDYLNVKGPLLFGGASYNLSWSSHSSANSYKQEYLIKGDKSEMYKSMLMLDFLAGDVSMENIVTSKMAELKALKETNPYVSYMVYHKNTEVMLDFLISANAPDGKTIKVLEHNVYRYKKMEYAPGHSGILLFGLSVRYYGHDESVKFISSLKSNNKDAFVYLKNVGEFNMPKVSIKK